MTHAAVLLQHYLFNSLWQVPLLFAAAWLVTRLVPHDAALRHRIWVSALLLQCVLPACYAPQQLKTMLHTLLRHGSKAGTLVTVGIGEGVVYGGLHAVPSLTSAITLLYAVTTGAFAARLVWRCRRVTLMRRAARPISLRSQDTQIFASYCQQLRISDIPLASSTEIFSPVTAGVTRRIVLLPQVLVHGAISRDLHAAFAHELAHVERRDFAKNLFYEFISLPIAWHPAVWPTRGALAESREMVCDETAADLLQGRHIYAHALLRLAALLTTMPPSQTSHAIGMLDANAFERRIMELSRQSDTPGGPRRTLAVAASSVVMLFACGSALALSSGNDIATVTAEAQSESGQRSLTVPSGVMAGNVLHKTTPVYPVQAKEAKISGAVVLSAIIDKQGNVRSLQVKSGPEELQQSALDAVKFWTYKPYLLNGDPTEVETTITVNYSFSK